MTSSVNHIQKLARRGLLIAYDLLWDPLPKEQQDYKDASAWGSEFRTDQIDGYEISESNKGTIEFLYETAVADVTETEDSYQSLRTKCTDLLKLNSALIVGVFALIRYFKTQDSPMGLATLASGFLLFSILVLWRSLAGVPKIRLPNAKRLAEWHRQDDSETEVSLKYAVVSFSHRIIVANEYVNSWVSRRLSLAWFVTLMALTALCSELFIVSSVSLFG